jgi:hypothetical protein
MLNPSMRTEVGSGVSVAVEDGVMVGTGELSIGNWELLIVNGVGVKVVTAVGVLVAAKVGVGKRMAGMVI